LGNDEEEGVGPPVAHRVPRGHEHGEHQGAARGNKEG
jgi:hypothetical protein